jgi:periplasmic copper chaperone A
MKKIVFLVLIAAMWLAGCQPARITTGILDIKNPWARPAAESANGAVYFVIENGTSQDDVLLSGRTDIASVVELHESEIDGDHMSMHHQDEVVLPAGEAVEFSPGGLHIMLVGLTRQLKAGETFDITLVFKQAGEKTVTVSVKDDVNDD